MNAMAWHRQGTSPLLYSRLRLALKRGGGFLRKAGTTALIARSRDTPAHALQRRNDSPARRGTAHRRCEERRSWPSGGKRRHDETNEIARSGFSRAGGSRPTWDDKRCDHSKGSNPNPFPALRGGTARQELQSMFDAVEFLRTIICPSAYDSRPLWFSFGFSVPLVFPVLELPCLPACSNLATVGTPVSNDAAMGANFIIVWMLIALPIIALGVCFLERVLNFRDDAAVQLEWQGKLTPVTYRTRSGSS